MSLTETWNKQYEGEVVTALKDENLFTLEVEALITAVIEQVSTLRSTDTYTLLELGSGTGELIRRMDQRIKIENKNLKFFGVDFSENAIKLARNKSNSRQFFHQSDFISYLKTIPANSVSIVVTQRSIMALMKEADQKDLLYEVNRVMIPGGSGVFSECFAADFQRFNTLRHIANLPPIDKVWHSRYLDESMLNIIFSEVSFRHFCSTYMLTTRVIYPTFEEPVHNKQIHNVASQLPDSGSTSFLKLAIVKKETI